MIKEAFLESADLPCNNFNNKSEIVSAINSLQLSAGTVTRRAENMSVDISQMKKKTRMFAFILPFNWMNMLP